MIEKWTVVKGHSDWRVIFLVAEMTHILFSRYFFLKRITRFSRHRDTKKKKIKRVILQQRWPLLVCIYGLENLSWREKEHIFNLSFNHYVVICASLYFFKYIMWQLYIIRKFALTFLCIVYLKFLSEANIWKR